LNAHRFVDEREAQRDVYILAVLPWSGARFVMH
jgi:hypothetical protein